MTKLFTAATRRQLKPTRVGWLDDLHHGLLPILCDNHRISVMNIVCYEHGLSWKGTDESKYRAWFLSLSKIYFAKQKILKEPQTQLFGSSMDRQFNI